jgi:hypothetical protein
LLILHKKILNPYNRLFLPLIGHLIFVSVLLTIPGDSLPGDGFFGKIPLFDKWVHIGLFSLMAGLMCHWLLKSGIRADKRIRYFIWCGFVCLAYGIAMEFIQLWFVPLRSFDNGDIVADATGSVMGVLFSMKKYK